MAKRFCKRPWGWWAVILDRKHFKVKLLRFKAGGALSMQKHHHRAELWCVLAGGGEFDFRNERPIQKSSGDVEIMPDKYWHSFKAFVPTWVLEIQYGEKCVEEDITRV